MLEIMQLTKYYGSQMIFENLNFEIEKGNGLQLTGRSGIGKTTLLRCIAGLEIFSKGSIKLDRTIIQTEKIFIPPHKRRIGMVFQDLALWPHMTLWQNVDFAASDAIKNRKIRMVKTEEILTRFKIIHKKNQFPAELSGGEQQRAAIARSLANNPVLLLLDEPFNQLDRSLVEQIWLEIETLAKENEITILMTTHHPIGWNLIPGSNRELSHIL